ncbi:hypothetical protein NDU88_002630 [Pleurodeles waltl]|uniref:Uncharacterized protein n=1 Tax=Pleurodeles waltl TaxID=8319 RepID=A0AAV7WQG1_PLEWA|nr:hypothetical protein NDU88_002630 [Pleurodeles waltl]
MAHPAWAHTLRPPASVTTGCLVLRKAQGRILRHGRVTILPARDSRGEGAPHRSPGKQPNAAPPLRVLKATPARLQPPVEPSPHCSLGSRVSGASPKGAHATAAEAGPGCHTGCSISPDFKPSWGRCSLNARSFLVRTNRGAHRGDQRCWIAIRMAIISGG